MRELTSNDLQQVSGGAVPLAFALVVAALPKSPVVKAAVAAAAAVAGEGVGEAIGEAITK